MTNQKKAFWATVAFIIVSCFWATGFAVVKGGLSQIKPLTVMMYRFIIGSIILSVFYAGKMKTVKMPDIKKGAFLGLFMFTGMLCAILGISMTTASKQSFILNSFVLIMPYLAWAFNKTKPDKYAVMATILATVGLGLITIQDGVSFNRGDILSYISSIVYAFHIILIERYANKIDPVLSTLIQFIFTACAFTVCAGVFDGFDLSVLIDNKFFFAYTIIFTTVLPLTTQNIVQQYISSTTTSLIVALQAAIGCIFAFFYLGEMMTARMAIGCVILFFAMIALQTKLQFITRLIKRGNAG